MGIARDEDEARRKRAVPFVGFVAPAQAARKMARELGMNPYKLGKLANHRQEPWKLTLPDFIARSLMPPGTLSP